jgi:hypothetical protein
MEPAQFLNIDLDVRSRRSLAPLVTAWPWAYQPMTAGGPPSPNPRWILINAPERGKTAEALAKHLLRHIEQLRGEARQSWKSAYRRVFDIGVQAGGPGRAFEDVTLTADTLKRIAAVGAAVQITVYPAVPE